MGRRSTKRYRSGRTIPNWVDANRAARILQQAFRAYRAGRNIYDRVNNWYSGGPRVSRATQTSSPIPFPNPTSTVATQAGQRKMSRRFYTVGKLGRRFKRSKKVRHGKFLRHGITRYVETGGTVSALNCPYVGHAFAPAQIFATMADCVIQRLFKKAGYRIVSMQHKPGTVASIRWDYRNAEGEVLTARAFNIAVTDTYQIVADALRTDIFAAASSGADDFQMYSIQLRNDTTGTEFMASLYFDDIWIEFDCSSSLAIQNRTLADSTSADAANKNEVTNNPIGGKSYQGYGTGSTLKLLDQTVSISKSMLTANRNSGVISFDIDSANITTQQKNLYKRPNAAGAYARVTKSAPAMLQPGQIKNSRLVWKKNIAWNSMVKKLFEYIKEDGLVNQYLPIGFFRFFAFEKKCNTQLLAESTVDVGYELNSVYRCRITSKMQICAPYIDVI